MKSVDEQKLLCARTQKTALTLTSLYRTLLSLVRKLAVGYKQRWWVPTEILGCNRCALMLGSLEVMNWSLYPENTSQNVRRAVCRKPQNNLSLQNWTCFIFFFLMCSHILLECVLRKNNVRVTKEKQRKNKGNKGKTKKQRKNKEHVKTRCYQLAVGS